MIKAEYTKVIKGVADRTTGFVIVDEYGNEMEFTESDLADKVEHGEMEITNLVYNKQLRTFGYAKIDPDIAKNSGKIEAITNNRYYDKRNSSDYERLQLESSYLNQVSK